MNLKRTLFTGLAAIGLMASIAAPVATAQVNGSSAGTTAFVVVASPGVFTLSICADSINATLDTTVQPTAGVQGKAEGSLDLCYIDTKSYRPNFNVMMQASNFQDGTKPIIPATGFKVVNTADVSQGQWSSGAGRAIGDIGHFQNNVYPTAGQGTTTAWTSSNDLSAARTVGFGYNGEGTIESTAEIDVELTMPYGTQDGTYWSNVTVTVVTPGTQFK
jgi:hypothetical protein